MSHLSRLVRTHPFASFAVLACLFGWSIFIAVGLGAGGTADNMPLGPLAAAIIVTAIQGKDARRAYWQRLRRWAAAPVWYAVAILTPALVHVVNVAVNHAFGAPWPTAHQLAAWPDVLSGFVMMLVMVGIGEEAGWTAFAAPMLMREHGLVGTWARLSAIRITWHLPLMLTGEMPWFMGIVGNAAFQMLLLLLVRGGGRWSLAATWHASLNALGGLFLFTMVTGADRERLGVLLAVAYAVLAVGWFALDRRSGRRSTSWPETEPAPDAGRVSLAA